MKEIIDRASWRPELVSHDNLQNYITQHAGVTVVDQYNEQLEEILQLRNPRYRFEKNYQDHLEKFIKEHGENSGSWFFYPWLNALIHFLPESMHQELRTGRNRNLITKEEQEKIYNSTIAVLGMSVGSHAALTIVLIGAGKNLKIADMDTISGSNTNRIRTGFQNIGVSKVVAAARQAFEINPYLNIEIFSEGVTENNLEKIIAGPKIDILVEEMDNPFFKFRAREYCKQHKIPLISAADNGDGVIAHVERYDTNPNQQLFNGLMGSMTADDVKNLDKKQLIGVIARTVGADRSVQRMQESVMEVGTTLYSWPQLGTAANLCGSVLAYLARRIILGSEKIASGIYDVSLDAIFESDYNLEETKAKRQGATREFLKKLNIN